MWPPRSERPGRTGLEPQEVAKETQLYPLSNLQIPAPQSSRTAPADLSLFLLYYKASRMEEEVFLSFSLSGLDLFWIKFCDLERL